MIEKIEISGVHYDVDKKLQKYVLKKIGNLDTYIPRKARESAHAEVMLKGTKKGDAKYTAEVIMHLPQDTITVSESTLNMYAAVDIIETKLKNQLKKYKETHANPRLYRRALGRLKRRGRVPEQLES